MNHFITPEEVVTMLKAHRGGKTLEEFSREVGCSFQFMSEVLRGRRGPGDMMLRYLKLERVIVYQRQSARS